MSDDEGLIPPTHRTDDCVVDEAIADAARDVGAPESAIGALLGAVAAVFTRLVNFFRREI